MQKRRTKQFIASFICLGLLSTPVLGAGVQQAPVTASGSPPTSCENGTNDAACVAQQPITPAQAAQSEPPAPIPVPPVDVRDGGGISSKALLGIGAAILGIGAYLLFKKKSHAPTTTPPPTTPTTP